MPPDMAISMRHTKLKAEEAALLAGEISKPSWQSKNEGIHERVSFEDSIWGFDLAGGVFYNTPLRVTSVKPDSRAEKAGIRPGDRLKRINDIDTSTLTIQEAHDIIIESGIHLKLSVTAPEDEEDSYYCYEDPLMDAGYDSEEERRLEEERAKKRRVCARVSHYWSLQWPWVSKRRLIYRESNCFMVPSKYEDERSWDSDTDTDDLGMEIYPALPSRRFTEDIVRYNPDGDQENQDNTKRTPSLWEVKEKTKQARKERLANNHVGDMSDDEEPPVKEHSKKTRRSTLKVNRQETIDESIEKEESESIKVEEDIDDINKGLVNEINEEMFENNDEVEETAVKEVDENNNEISSDSLRPDPEMVEENNNIAAEESAEVENAVDSNEIDMVNGEVSEDDILNEVLGKPSDSASRSDEDNILDSILSDEGQNMENSDNER